MSQHNGETPPTLEHLAAYVDGELEAAGRRQVEAWLADHPEAATEVEAQRRLLALWRQVPPRQPTEAEWAAVFNRVQAACITPMRKARSRRWAGVALALSATAAALGWMALGNFSRPPDPGLLPQPVSQAAEELFRVATAAEVEIISMDAADASFLVLGEPPLSEPLVLAAPGEIKFDKVEPDVDGMVPRLPDPQGPDVPMIVVPPAPAGVKD
ncbi:MAG: hypothetical protein L0Z62_25195 [Gemmataceae bacterium]|nr:hypothetical protein [Gemmataceae bacterium]